MNELEAGSSVAVPVARKVRQSRKGTEKEAVVASLATVLFFVLCYGISLLVGQVEFLKRVAIKPGEWGSLYSVVTYCIGHAHPMHLAMNMGQLVLLAACTTLMRGWRGYLEVMVLVLIGSGLFTWFTAPTNAMVIGASGITAGLASYLFIRSGIEKDLPIFALSSVFIALVVIGIMSTLMSHNEVVSWQAHAGGLLTGIVVVCMQLLKERRDAKLHSVVGA